MVAVGGSLAVAVAVGSRVGLAVTVGAASSTSIAPGTLQAAVASARADSRMGRQNLRVLSEMDMLACPSIGLRAIVSTPALDRQPDLGHARGWAFPPTRPGWHPSWMGASLVGPGRADRCAWAPPRLFTPIGPLRIRHRLAHLGHPAKGHPDGGRRGSGREKPVPWPPRSAPGSATDCPSSSLLDIAGHPADQGERVDSASAGGGLAQVRARSSASCAKGTRP